MLTAVNAPPRHLPPDEPVRILPAFIIVVLAAVLAAGCHTPIPGGDCAQDGTCPSGLSCFPDWRCYPPGAMPDCSPPCHGATPLCDPSTLRCVACLRDRHCPVGTICVGPNQRCVAGCAADHLQCASAAESCDVDAGVCHGCRSDGECTDPKAPRCDSATQRCSPCLPEGDNCPASQYCAGASGTWACAAGCKSQDDCAPDGGTGSAMACCAHRCIDSGGDANNCGGCGIACGGARRCCSGRCADLTSELDNCGACGLSCDLPNVGAPSCTAGKCANTGCESYFADCDRNPANGCEVNLTQDPNNCYGCGIKCPAPPHASAGCSVSNCGLGACDPGWADCNQIPGDGCEYDTSKLATDAHNCGACRIACAGNQSCVKGKCQ